VEGRRKGWREGRVERDAWVVVEVKKE
jgi:hypothetical protein